MWSLPSLWGTAVSVPCVVSLRSPWMIYIGSPSRSRGGGGISSVRGPGLTDLRWEAWNEGAIRLCFVVIPVCRWCCWYAAKFGGGRCNGVPASCSLLWCADPWWTARPNRQARRWVSAHNVWLQISLCSGQFVLGAGGPAPTLDCFVVTSYPLWVSQWGSRSMGTGAAGILGSIEMEWVLCLFGPWEEMYQVLLVIDTEGAQEASSLLICPLYLAIGFGMIPQC